VVLLARLALALWTLWVWRRQIARPGHNPHLSIALLFATVPVAACLSSTPADRALLLGLPAIATLAAFALPTFRRSISALIDWFTLLFFTASAIVWVVWLAFQTGFPPKIAANIARLAPQFEANISWPTVIVALIATAGWFVLVIWRTSRNRAAIWKSLVLPPAAPH
jgi:glucan phosphoethanolaminetransferase (alkaline phosphatase superfamily)